MPATKLLCTLGPASGELVADLVRAGMDVARINCSHGERKDHDRLVEAVRRAAIEAGRPVGIMADLSGPKVRLGELAGGAVTLKEGSSLTLGSEDDKPGDATRASVNHPGLASDLEAGDRIFLADGAAELRVTGTGAETVTTVVRGGPVRSRAGVNVPSEKLSLPAITDKDRRDLEWALDTGVDLIGQSFVRRAEDVAGLRDLIGDNGPLVLAKIETRAAVEDAERILEVADAIMVARGDLGVETALEEIPVIQKGLVARANRAALPVIIATQMLESMTRNPRPTRAEASDVAGAVFDGADGILLSAETAIGAFPVESAATAERILTVAETRGAPYIPSIHGMEEVTGEEVGLARAAAVVAGEDRAVAIACFTRSGMTARLLSAVRPRVPVYAFSPDPRTVGRMNVFHGVVPFLSDEPRDLEGLIEMMDRRLRGARLCSSGQDVVMVASSPAGQSHANLVKLHRVGSGAEDRPLV